MLCDTYSLSTSRAVIVTLVQVRERHGPLAHRRAAIRCLQSVWRLVTGVLQTTPMTAPAAGGTGPPVSRAGACFGVGVRPLLPPRDDSHALMLLLPESMRHTC